MILRILGGILIILLIMVVGYYLIGDGEKQMHKEINTEIIIHGSVEEVWNVLMDFDAYPEWNPFITRIEGNQEVGAKLKVMLQSPDGSSMKFEPKVIESKQFSVFAWKGKLLVGGLFDGAHRFELVKVAENQTLLKHSEVFNGLLVMFVGKELKKTEQNFYIMNESLKQRVENK
ncbi:SRPBCC family protein [Acinetobacter haemolyticus]|uniref:SRPBCC family protein n=1 Tax=Acinetobacter haemolyticus TaxID=29430 RepID=UPI003F57235F